MKTMAAVREQGEAMPEMTRNRGVLREGPQEMSRQRADPYESIRKTCLGMMEDHF
ncbi:MAG TPA: hypothetical protein P5551_12285 [Syntrophales bacterium]|nr:hypothetical protein [Syntrophobacterales bacterium]HNQ00945.1 hypothetical protein [Syntrophales bacterium]HNS53721.1 hypothetical protein [Syntrophales bacterium]HRT63122.1 hypothetical protein [Syntrophales bacterium]